MELWGTDLELEQLSRFERVEALKNMLVARATGGAGDENLFRVVRRELLRNSELNPRMPRFLRTCRNVDEFWQFVKGQHDTYQQRRDFLRDEFEPLLSYLEAGELSPLSASSDLALSVMTAEAVHDVWRRMMDRRNSDPEGAITAARTLVETVCKHILEDVGKEYATNAELPTLYKAAAAELHIAPDQHTEQVFKQILGGCASVVGGLAGVRNKLSDAHGKGPKAARPAPRHAELAVNLAGSLAAFLVATWVARTTDEQA